MKKKEKEKKSVKVGYIFGKLEIFFIKLHWKVCNKQKKKKIPHFHRVNIY